VEPFNEILDISAIELIESVIPEVFGNDFEMSGELLPSSSSDSGEQEIAVVRTNQALIHVMDLRRLLDAKQYPSHTGIIVHCRHDS
jgi:hypothetical protein